MSIANLITQGIGPDSSVKAIVLDGLDIADVQLIIQDALHNHLVDSVGFDISVIIASALHGHIVDNVSFDIPIVIDGALHSHVVDNVGFDISVIINGALHTHNADNIDLSQIHLLVISDALHSHLADNATIFEGTIQTPDGRVIIIKYANRMIAIMRDERLIDIPNIDKTILVK